MPIREDLHHLVDELTDEEALLWLQALQNRDPMLVVLARAHPDDEPTTPEEDPEADDAWEQYLQGLARPWEEVRDALAHG